MFTLVLILLVVFVGAVLALALRNQQRVGRQRDIDQRYDQLSHRVSERLRFRRPTQSDRGFYSEMADDPVAAENNGWNGREAEWVHRRFDDDTLFAHLAVSELVAFERKTGARVGTATFTKSPRGHDARSIGVHVHPDHRNQGYGREIMAGAILLLQETPGPVHIGTRVTNVAMQRIMEQLGFASEPELHPYKAPDGQSYDAYWYQCGADTHPPTGIRPS